MYKWITALCSKGRPMTGLMIIGIAQRFYDKMKISDKASSLRTGLKNPWLLGSRNSALPHYMISNFWS